MADHTLGLPPIPREAFNEVSRTLGGGVCWARDEKNPGEIDPEEAGPCRPGQPLNGFVREGRFTEKFDGYYERVARSYRRELIQKELAKTEVARITVNLNDYRLTPEQKQMVGDILGAGEAMDTLYQIQRGALAHKPEIDQNGTKNDREFYRRYQTVWCEDHNNPYGTAAPSLPAYATPLYPDGINCEKLEGAELTNPFSTIHQDSTGRLQTTPFAQDPDLKYAQAEAAAKLRQAAQSARAADEPKLAVYLEEVANALLSQKPYPYVKADEAWVNAKDSRFYVRIGADEPYYEDTCHIRATYHMSLGIKDPVAEAAIQNIMPHMQDFEKHLAGLIPGYVTRPVPLETPEFVDIVMENGASRGQISGTAIAQTLPNWCGENGKADCRTRAVQFMNKMRQSYNNKPFRDQLARLLSKNVMDHFQFGAITDKAVYHEISHNLGPQMKQYQEKLGDILLWMEEFKAEIGALALLPALEKAGLATPQESRARFAGLLAWCAGQIRRAAHRGEKYYETKSPYQQLAAVIVGHFTQQGAFLFKDGVWDIDWNKTQSAADSLYSQVGQLYLKGDKPAVIDFFKRYTSGDGIAHLHLDRIQETVGKVPSTLFSYQILGLKNHRRKTPSSSRATRVIAL